MNWPGPEIEKLKAEARALIAARAAEKIRKRKQAIENSIGESAGEVAIEWHCETARISVLGHRMIEADIQLYVSGYHLNNFRIGGHGMFYATFGEALLHAGISSKLATPFWKFW